MIVRTLRLAEYDVLSVAESYPAASDHQVLRHATKKKRILLVKRKFPPFQGAYALPGGFTELAEGRDEAIVRETKEETGIILDYGEYKYIGLFDKKGRDPRGPVCTYGYLIQVADIEERMGDFSDVQGLELVNIADLKDFELAFDHRDIINKALRK